MMSNEVEKITPYESTTGKAEQVRQMFDAIAPAYDFMNRAMTLGIDRWWRRRAVSTVKRHTQGDLLDVATGTGDFAILLHDRCQARSVTGIDLSEGMLAVARRKVQGRRIAFEQGDCLALPYGDGTFDAVTVAFGVRNFADIAAGYGQMHRVLRPGGMVAVLELSTPTQRVIRWLYDLYTLHIIPWVGALISHDREAYRYLPRSIAAVPQGNDMLALMRSAGFEDCQARRFTLGTCTLYTAVKAL